MNYHTLQGTTTHYHTLPCTTTHYYTQQPTTTHYHTQPHYYKPPHTTHRALPHTTTHYRELPHSTRHYHAILHITMHYHTLQCTTTHYRTLPHATTLYNALPNTTTHSVSCTTSHYYTLVVLCSACGAARRSRGTGRDGTGRDGGSLEGRRRGRTRDVRGTRSEGQSSDRGDTLGTPGRRRGHRGGRGRPGDTGGPAGTRGGTHGPPEGHPGGRGGLPRDTSGDAVMPLALHAKHKLFPKPVGKETKTSLPSINIQQIFPYSLVSESLHRVLNSFCYLGRGETILAHIPWTLCYGHVTRNVTRYVKSYNLIGLHENKTADSAQPRKRAIVTRPFSLAGVWSGHETMQLSVWGGALSL